MLVWACYVRGAFEVFLGKIWKARAYLDANSDSMQIPIGGRSTQSRYAKRWGRGRYWRFLGPKVCWITGKRAGGGVGKTAGSCQRSKNYVGFYL